MAYVRSRRRPSALLALAWIIGFLGTVTTLISVAPSLGAATKSLSDPGSTVPALTAVAIALLGIAVPVMLSLAIADHAQRRWFYVALAAIAVVVLLVLRPGFGSLGIWWLSAAP